MPRRCTCTAGSEANGWHQDWCDDCRADELDQWAKVTHDTLRAWAGGEHG